MVSDEGPTLGSNVEPLAETIPAASREGPDGQPPGLDGGQLVGLGEGTHGTREFVTLRHRFVQHLVVARGFRTLAFETPFEEMLALDTAVRRDDPEPESAVAELGLWAWQTEGLVSLLRWVCRFNEGRQMGDRVRLVGIGLTDPGTPAERLGTLLSDLGVPEESLTDDLAAFADTNCSQTGRIEDIEQGAKLAATAQEHLLEWRGEPETHMEHVTHRLCRQLELSCDWNELRMSSPGRFDAEAYQRRDRSMAETAIWALETDPGSGAVVWAHNSHVQRGHFDMPQDWATGIAMGEFIDREVGTSYRPLGTTFGRGRYRAVSRNAETPEEPRPHEAAPPLEDSVEQALLAIGEYPQFLDLKGMPRTGLPDWTQRDRLLRSVPALIDEEADPADRYMETELPAAFDGLFFVPESSPTRLLGDRGEE